MSAAYPRHICAYGLKVSRLEGALSRLHVSAGNGQEENIPGFPDQWPELVRRSPSGCVDFCGVQIVEGSSQGSWRREQNT
jgi:hypothetical protein